MTASSESERKQTSADASDQEIGDTAPPVGPQPNQDEGWEEGGIKGWACVVGAFLAMFSSFGFLNAIGLFQSYYESHLLSDYDPSAISWIFTVQLFLMFFLGGFNGAIIDHFGPHVVLIPSSALCILSIALTSLCTKYYQVFLAQGLGFGIGASGVFTASAICVGQWFHRRRALAIGIAAAGSSLGGVIHPIFVSRMIRHVGFPGAIRYTALLLGICLAGSCLLVRRRFPRREWKRESLTFLQFSLFKQPAFLLYCIGGFSIFWGLFGAFNYLPTFAMSKGFDEETAVYTIVAVNAASIFGRIGPAHLGDMWGRFEVNSAISLLTGILIFAFWLPLGRRDDTTHAQIFAFAAVYGFWSGAYISLMLPCVAELGPVQSLGRRMGTWQAFVAIATLTGLPIQGALITKDNGEFLGLQIFSGVCIIFGSVFVHFAGVMRKKRAVSD